MEWVKIRLFGPIPLAYPHSGFAALLMAEDGILLHGVNKNPKRLYSLRSQSGVQKGSALGSIWVIK